MTNIIDLRDPRFETDKYAYIEELRTQGFWARTADGYVVFNQREAEWVFACEDFRFHFFQIDPEQSPYLSKAIEHELLNMHGAAHGRLRRLVSQALRDRILEDLRARVTAIVDDLIDAMPDHGVVDFCADFCDPLPARVLGPMYGIPYEDVDGLNDWIRVGGRKVDALLSGDGIDVVEAANRNLHDYLRDLLAARRAAPGEDLFSALMLADLDGDRLGEDELVYLAGEMAAAGVDTTRAQLPLILFELLVAPSQLALLQQDPGLALRAVDEGMRFAPLPWAIPHQATRDVTWHGLSLKAGDLVQVMVPAANRDPAAMADPNRFDMTRDRVRHFGFGHGLHGCPGAQIARMEMSIALRRLVERISSFKLVAEPERDAVQKGGGPLVLQVEIQKS